MDVDNWGLEAVVRGCSRSITAAGASPFSDDHIDRWEIAGLADPIKSSVALDDLEAIYKPFYPCEHPVTSPLLGIDPCSGPGLDRELTARTTTSPVASVLESAPLAMTKYQRRKNQQIRVVEHVTAEDLLSTDKWAWRKYGQKPVKGSPYQRSYYRCSTSRGCPARKKVERSGSDPQTFIVIYADDHNHPQPARRNSLAGSTRKRLPDVVPDDNYNSRTDPEVPTVEGHRADSPISTVVMSSPKADLIESNCDDQGYSCQGDLGFGEVMVEEIVDDGKMANSGVYSGIEALQGTNATQF